MAQNSTIDTTPSSVATNALNDLPFDNLIGGPLNACVKAQADAAMTTWNFIKEVGLSEDKDGNRTLNYVSFTYNKNGRQCTVNVPLLTIVPIPYIAIRDIDIAFKAKISASSSTTETKKESVEKNFSNKTKVSGGTWFVRASTEFQAGYSSKKDSTATRDSKYSVEYTMDVAVKAGQDDIPAGMAKILELLNESVDTVEKGGNLHLSTSVVNLASENNADHFIYITYKDEDGLYKNDKSLISVKKRDTSGNFTAATNEDCKLNEDDPGFTLEFLTEGTYQIAAGTKGDKKATVQVIH
ncbi:MAG: DUF2589 domain-containing protein [Bacteroidales bacterium]|nr:DUF2589 domain-containing protein [Bacteroidales bacterium]